MNYFYDDDDDDDCETHYCLVSDTEPTKLSKNKYIQFIRRQQSFLLDAFLFAVPILSPLFAFIAYEEVARLSDILLDSLSNNNWVAVDGGAYEAQIITPAINGITLPAISILFATLIGNTFSGLRERQQDIRTALNREAGEIRVLQSMAEAFPTPWAGAQERLRSYLIQYTSRVIAESQQGVDFNSLEACAGDSEINGVLLQINQLVLENEKRRKNQDDNDTNVNEIASIPELHLVECYNSLARLNAQRTLRISALQSTFPPLHFTILSVLAGSICLAFLMETNQDLLIFLNALQLKILWSMLVGTFSALGVVCYDLVDPFRGSYQISKTVNQLYTIRSALRASVRMATNYNNNDGGNGNGNES